jgi:hypothetical protein
MIMMLQATKNPPVLLSRCLSVHRRGIELTPLYGLWVVSSVSPLPIPITSCNYKAVRGSGHEDYF